MINSKLENLNNIKNRRNIAIVAHIDAGKTTTTERIIYYAQARGKHKIGEVHDGNTTTDYLTQEKERGITIVSAAINLRWKDKDISLVDSPGHVDFTIEVERSLSVLEGAVVIIDGSSGVQPQTECVWRQAQRYSMSRLVFINKMDKDGADFERSMDSLKKRLSNNCIYIQYPYIVNEKFVGIYDLVYQKLYIWQGRDHNYNVLEFNDMNESQKSSLLKYRNNMLDDISVYDDEIMDMFLSNQKIDNKFLSDKIKSLCCNMKMFPVICGSSFHNKGVQSLLDAIIDYLPSPIESSNIDQEMISSLDGSKNIIRYDTPETVIFCFKWVRDRHIGPISYCRIYSGIVRTGDIIYSSNNNSKIRIVSIVKLFANQYDIIKEAYAGEIIGIVGQNIVTGDVLSPDNRRYKMSKIVLPESIVYVAIKPKTEEDQDRFSRQVADIKREDPTIDVEYSEQGETLIRGVGSLQIEVLIERLKEKNINLEVFRPKVSYRTTILQANEFEYLHKKQTGGAGQFAKVLIAAEPYKKDIFCFVNDVKGGNIPEQFIPSVKASVIKTLKTGVYNCQVINIKISLKDGEAHKVDSSDIAFQEATRVCINKLLTICKPVLLEPYAKVTIYTPSNIMDKIIGEACSKGGVILKVENDKYNENDRIIIMEMPMIHTFDYPNVLRSISSGYASCTYEFSVYKEAMNQPDINHIT